MKRALTLDRPVIYRIDVPGHLDDGWSDWMGRMTVSYQVDEAGRPITILTGAVDQAALQGLLRRLYAMGLPIISVSLVD